MAVDYPPYHVFVCPECEDDTPRREYPERLEMDRKEFIAHLKEVHGINVTKGTRTLMMHMSRKPRHCASYEWTIGGKTFYEYRG